ncbi:MAG: hypothetical protein ABMB14_17330 [Myxococcota bacterium]
MSARWTIVPRATLGDRELRAMLAIHHALYTGVDDDRFARDLQGKDEVIVVTDPTGAVVGYTTLSVYEDPTGWVLFSGDTGVAPGAAIGSALQVGWLAAALQWHDRVGPLWWLLLAGGPRTYRYLPVFFRDHWPRADVPTPPEVSVRLDALGTRRYGDRYAAGIVRLGEPPLRAEHDVVRPDDPHDRWFRAVNPGWVRGDELACLTRIAPDNLTDAGRRILRQAR